MSSTYSSFIGETSVLSFCILNFMSPLYYYYYLFNIVTACNPELSLDFENPNQLTTSTDMMVTLHDVTISNGVAMFSSRSEIRTNLSLSQAAASCQISVEFRYREESAVAFRQVLATSPGCRTIDSTTMVIAVLNDSLVFELKDWFGTQMQLALPTKVGWIKKTTTCRMFKLNAKHTNTKTEALLLKY